MAKSCPPRGVIKRLLSSYACLLALKELHEQLRLRVEHLEPEIERRPSSSVTTEQRFVPLHQLAEMIKRAMVNVDRDGVGSLAHNGKQCGNVVCVCCALALRKPRYQWTIEMSRKKAQRVAATVGPKLFRSGSRPRVPRERYARAKSVAAKLPC